MAARIVPDSAALAIAHSKLRTPMSMKEMLERPNLRAVLEALARKHMQRRAQPDIKRLQANDFD